MVLSSSIENYTHDTSLLAYLDLFSIFLAQKEVFGGQVNDLFTTSHTYGKTSIVIIPADKKAEFLENNPSFLGELRLYDPASQRLRNVINQIRQEKETSQWMTLKDQIPVVDFDGISEYQSIQIHGQDVPFSIFDNLFKKHGLYIGTHSGSPYRRLELLLTYFCHIFHAYHLSLDCKLFVYSLPSQHLKPLKLLVEYAFHDFFEAITPLNQAEQDRLKEWEKECWGFIHLHDLEAELRQHKKSLFFNKETLKIGLRNKDTVTIEQLQKNLLVVEQPIQIIEESGILPLLDTKTIPQYYMDFFLSHPNILKGIRFMESKIVGWPYGPGMILADALIRYFQSNTITIDSIQNNINFAFQASFSPEQQQVLNSYVKNLFVHFSNINQKKAFTFLKSCHPNFRKLLGFPAFLFGN